MDDIVHLFAVANDNNEERSLGVAVAHCTASLDQAIHGKHEKPQLAAASKRLWIHITIFRRKFKKTYNHVNGNDLHPIC